MKRRIDNVYDASNQVNVSLRNIEYCHIKKDTTTQSIPYNTITSLNVLNDDFKSVSGMAPAPVSTITIKKSGLYMVSVFVSWLDDTSITDRRILIYVNGVATRVKSEGHFNLAGIRHPQIFTCTLDLQLNDTIAVYLFQSNANLAPLSVGGTGSDASRIAVALISDGISI